MLNKKQVWKQICFKLITPLLLLCISIAVKASVISKNKDTSGLLFKLDKGLMYIAVCKDDIIEVKYTTFKNFSKRSSLIVNVKLGHTVFDVRKNKNQVIITTARSTRGDGLMWDNYSASNFYDAEEGNTKFKYVSESGREVDYYFFYGPGFDQIINLYRTTTGKAPMFPKWAFGMFQSQDRYLSQDEILSVKNKYRDNHIPVDVIMQDWYYRDPFPIGVHARKLYGDAFTGI